MLLRSLSKFLRFSSVLVVGVFGSAAFAQGPIPDAPRPIAEAVSPSIEASPAVFATAFRPTAPRVEGQHRFWDTSNRVLFAVSAGMNAADFAVTRANLQSGGQELNPIVRVLGRSTAGLAVNFAGGTAGVIGLSYLFHKTGHHKLERMVSVVNIGASTVAVSYGLAHR